MSFLSSHKCDIRSQTEDVLIIGTGGRVDTKLISQAVCICGWKGPRRGRLYQAEDDVTEHKRNPEEGQ